MRPFKPPTYNPDREQELPIPTCGTNTAEEDEIQPEDLPNEFVQSPPRSTKPTVQLVGKISKKRGSIDQSKQVVHNPLWEINAVRPNKNELEDFLYENVNSPPRSAKPKSRLKGKSLKKRGMRNMKRHSSCKARMHNMSYRTWNAHKLNDFSHKHRNKADGFTEMDNIHEIDEAENCLGDRAILPDGNAECNLHADAPQTPSSSIDQSNEVTHTFKIEPIFDALDAHDALAVDTIFDEQERFNDIYIQHGVDDKCSFHEHAQPNTPEPAIPDDQWEGDGEVSWVGEMPIPMHDKYALQVKTADILSGDKPFNMNVSKVFLCEMTNYI